MWRGRVILIKCDTHAPIAWRGKGHWWELCASFPLVQTKSVIIVASLFSRSFSLGHDIGCNFRGKCIVIDPGEEGSVVLLVGADGTRDPCHHGGNDDLEEDPGGGKVSGGDDPIPSDEIEG